MKDSVTVVGAGGNIGSHLIPHLARTPEITRLTLVDHDVYEQKNVFSQNVTTADVGQPKASVQARRASEIDPTLDVVALAASVTDVPLGVLRAHVLLACVDSRIARRSVNEIAWRLGVPWIDAAVRADGLLVRINVYTPGPGQPCLECSWDDEDYALLEQAYPCGVELVASPTNAPSALGGLAAALQALECRMILADRWRDVAVGRQVTISAVGHRQLVTTLRPNPHCRFDHETWNIEPVEGSPDALTPAETLQLAGRRARRDGALRVAGHVFVRKLACPRCGSQREMPLHLLDRLPPDARRCERDCGPMYAAGFDRFEWLEPDAAGPDASLAGMGVREGDVLSVRSSKGTTHYQIGALL